MGVRSHPTRKSGSLWCQPQKNLVLEGSRQCRQKDPKRMSSSAKERVACLEWELYYNRLERDTDKGGWRQAEEEKEAAAAAKSHQSCPTLCDPIDGSPPGSPIAGILQARTLEWVAISFSSAWKWKWSRCLTPHDPMDCSPPGSSVHGISQARVLEWAAIAFSSRRLMV